MQGPAPGLGQSQAQVQSGKRMIETSPGEKDLGVFVDKKFNMNWQCMFEAHKADHIMGCIKRGMTSNSKEVILPLYHTLVRPHLDYCVQLWCSQHTKEVDLLEQVQRRAMKLIKGLEHLSYKKQTQSWGCSAWRREGSDEKLEQPSSTQRALTRSLERDFS